MGILPSSNVEKVVSPYKQLVNTFIFPDCVTFVAFVSFSEFVIYFFPYLLEIFAFGSDFVFISWFSLVYVLPKRAFMVFSLKGLPKMVQASGPPNFELALAAGNEQGGGRCGGQAGHC